MQRILVVALGLCLLVATGVSAEPVDDMKALIGADDFPGLLELHNQYASRDDFEELETILIGLAKEQVVASNYETALQILDVVLRVNLFNLEAQEIYISVNSLIKGRVPGSDAPVIVRDEPEPTGDGDRTVSAGDPVTPKDSPSTLTSTPSSSAAPATETSPATSAALPDSSVVTSQSPETTVSTGDTGEDTDGAATADAPVVAAAEETATETSTGTTAADEPTAAQPTAAQPVEPTNPATRVWPPMSYEAYIGPVSLLGYASGFYRDFYGSGRFNLSYGLSVDASLLLHFPSVVVGPELSLDGHFANLTAAGGDQIAYKVVANVGFPDLTPLPLFFRLGFMQQWYLFGSDLPDVLITSFPSPTLGAKIIGITLDGRVALDAAIDLFAISLFTSYFSLGFDAAVSVNMEFPLTESLSLAPRIGLQPQMLFAFGNMEFFTKLEFSIGVVSHEP